MAVTVGRTRIRHDWKCASAPGRDDTVAFEDLRNQAKEAFSLGEYEAAHNLYASAAKAIVAVDTDPAAALSLATCLANGAACSLQLNRLEECLDLAERALDLTTGAAANGVDAAALTAKCLYRRALACAKLGRSVSALVALLRAARHAPSDASIARELRKGASGATWRPPLSSKKRAGMHVTLLLDEQLEVGVPVAAEGSHSAAAFFTRTNDGKGRATPTSSTRRRFPSWLLGSRSVPRFRSSEPHEADAFLEMVGQGLPAVLEGGALIGGDTPVGQAWSADNLLDRIDGRQVVALMAPAACNRKFKFYRLPEKESDEGDYDIRSYFQEGKFALKTTTTVQSKGFVRRRDAQNAETVPYLQVPMYTKDGGWGKVSNNVPPELGHEVMASLNISALELIKEHGGLGKLISSTLFIA